MTIYNLLSRIYDPDKYVRLFITDYNGDIGYYNELTYYEQSKIMNRFITRFEFDSELYGKHIIVKVRVA